MKNPSYAHGLTEILLKRFQFHASHHISADFFRDIQVRFAPPDGRKGDIVDQWALSMTASLFAAPLMPQVSKEKSVEVARVPRNRLHMLFAALGLPHKTRPIMATTETHIHSFVPIGVSMTGAVPLDQDRVFVPYMNAAAYRGRWGTHE